MSAATATAPNPVTMPGEKKGPIVSLKKEVKKKQKTAVDELTAEEREAVTIVFHQFETGLREGTIFTKVKGFIHIDFLSPQNKFKEPRGSLKTANFAEYFPKVHSVKLYELR